MLKWRIYYADGGTFDSSMGSPQEAPGAGVICIVSMQDGNAVLLHKWDWYEYNLSEGGEWWGHDIHGLLYQLTDDRLGHVTAVKQGGMASQKRFAEITQRALDDPDFPRVYRKNGDTPLLHQGVTE
jgi:hypothetical protein